MTDKPARRRSATSANRPARTKLSPRDRAAASVEVVAKRLQQLPTKLKRLPPELKATLNGIMTGGGEVLAKDLFALVLAIGKLPDDWKPAGAARGKGWEPTIGRVVQIREKRVAEYAGLVPPKTDLEVVAIYSSILGVREIGMSGRKGEQVLTIPRAHLQPKPSEPAKK